MVGSTQCHGPPLPAFLPSRSRLSLREACCSIQLWRPASMPLRFKKLLWLALSRFLLPLALRAQQPPPSKGASNEATKPATKEPAKAEAKAEPAKALTDPIDRIKDEGLNRSQLMATLSYLTDVIGPRLTGSPNLKRANEWTCQTLTKWGLANAHLAAWGPFGKGWTLKRFSAQVIEPQCIPLIAFPKAWSPSTDGALAAQVVYFDAKSEADFAKFQGKVKGAIVLTGPPREVSAGFEPLANRRTDVVMLGGHLDSWHSGTGATDNAAGVSVAMEAVRILNALDLKPRRTIRIGLWTGKEQGLFGSRAYVAQHFGNANDSMAAMMGTPEASSEKKDASNGKPSSSEPKPEYAKFSAYFNLDNGTGKIRGVYMQGNESVRPIFRKWLQPFRELGASTLTLNNTGGTDHQSFDGVGLPGFQFIQDEIHYNTRTHHSNQDVYDQIQAD